MRYKESFGVWLCLLHFDLLQQNSCTKAADEGVILFGDLSATLINVADKSVIGTSL